MARCHQRVPNLLAWSTYCDFKDRLDEIEDQTTPDTEVHPDVDEHVAFSGGCEDAEVLKQDGKFDEEDHEAVDNGRDINPLRCYRHGPFNFKFSQQMNLT